jgi:hypothetical protein
MLTDWFEPHAMRIDAPVLPNLHGCTTQTLCGVYLQVYGFTEPCGRPDPSHSVPSRTNRNPKEIS